MRSCKIFMMSSMVPAPCKAQIMLAQEAGIKVSDVSFRTLMYASVPRSLMSGEMKTGHQGPKEHMRVSKMRGPYTEP